MQIDSFPRFMDTNMNHMVPSPNTMDLDSDDIVPEFPSSFMVSSNHNNAFNYNHKYGANYSPNIADSIPTPNLNLDEDEDEEEEEDALPPQNSAASAPQISLESIEWSQILCSIAGDRHLIDLPINFRYTPTMLSSSHQPFQYQSPFEARIFRWSSITQPIIAKLFPFKEFFENKVVLEFGAGFGIASIASLLLGAKHVYVTDGDPAFSSIVPVIMNKNDVDAKKYTVKKLAFNDLNDMKHILRHCKKWSRGTRPYHGVDIMLACDVFDENRDCALNLFETVSFYFENFLSQQKRRFLRKKQREMELKNENRHQFNAIFGGSDVNRPITSGGYLPCVFAPQLYKKHETSGDNRDQVSILSRSDDDNSTTNSAHNMNTQLPPNTVPVDMQFIDNNRHSKRARYKYKLPYLNTGVSSLSAMSKVATVKPLTVQNTTSTQSKYNQYSKPSNIPKFKILNTKQELDADASAFDDDDDGDDDVLMDEINEEEMAQYLVKSKVNAPVFFLAINTRNAAAAQRDIKLKDDPFTTFCTKCVGAGYRVQNVVREWNYQLWIVKA